MVKPELDILPLLVNSMKSPDWYIHMSRKLSVGPNVSMSVMFMMSWSILKISILRERKPYMVLTEMVVIMLRVTKHR
jgi:hypothetical protein